MKVSIEQSAEDFASLHYGFNDFTRCKYRCSAAASVNCTFTISLL
jgi:hypothetical protein